MVSNDSDVAGGAGSPAGVSADAEGVRHAAESVVVDSRTVKPRPIAWSSIPAGLELFHRAGLI